LRTYETIFVIDSLLKSDEIDSIINKYERFISANGGAIQAIERWGKKRLAYEIKKRQYGYYVLIRFDGPPTMIKQLEREYRLNESLLRFKTLIMQPIALKHLADKLKQQQAAQAPAPTTVEPAAAAPKAEDKPTAEEPKVETEEAAEPAVENIPDETPAATEPEVEAAEESIPQEEEAPQQEVEKKDQTEE